MNKIETTINYLNNQLGLLSDMEYYGDLPTDSDYATLESLKAELRSAIIEAELDSAVSGCNSIEELQPLFPTASMLTVGEILDMSF